MQKCVNLIKKALKEKRRLTDKELEMFIIQVLKKYHVYSLIENINFDYHNTNQRTSFSVAYYNSVNNSLTFNMNNLNREVFTLHNKSMKRRKQDTHEKMLSFNEFYIWKQVITCFHEVRHVIQLCKFPINNVAITRIILESCYNMENYEIYKKYYHLFPIEKDAEVFAMINALKLFKECDCIDKDVMKNLEMTFFISILKGYDTKNNFESCLSEFCEKVIGDKDFVKDCSILCNNLSLIDKMSFNIPLNYDDIKKLSEIAKLINEGKGLEEVLLSNKK